MALLNYTTQIKSEKTAFEVQAILARAGATDILAQYREGQPIAISFIVKTQFGSRPFRLPIDPQPVYAVLRKQWQDGKVPRRYADMGQAQRVAWRIVKDWLEAQLALIETEMVSLEQVMLPYMTVDDGKTMFEALSEQGLRLQLQAGSAPPVIEGEAVEEAG